MQSLREHTKRKYMIATVTDQKNNRNFSRGGHIAAGTFEWYDRLTWYYLIVLFDARVLGAVPVLVIRVVIISPFPRVIRPIPP